MPNSPDKPLSDQPLISERDILPSKDTPPKTPSQIASEINSKSDRQPIRNQGHKGSTID